MDQITPGQVIAPGGAQNSPQPPAASPVPPNVTEGTHMSPIQPQPISGVEQPSQQSVQQVAVPERPGVSVAPSQPSVLPQVYQQLNQPVAHDAGHVYVTPADANAAMEPLGHEKGVRWYALYLVGLLLLSVAVYLFTKDLFSTFVVFAALFGLLFLSARKPKMQEFSVDAELLHVGGKVYNLQNFKAFSLIDEGPAVEIALVPIKRFMPQVSLYVPSGRADELTEHLADYLPFEQRKPDAMDTLLRRIRF